MTMMAALHLGEPVSGNWYCARCLTGLFYCDTKVKEAIMTPSETGCYEKSPLGMVQLPHWWCKMKIKSPFECNEWEGTNKEVNKQHIKELGDMSQLGFFYNSEL